MLLWYRNVFSNTTVQNRFCESNVTLSIPPNEGVAQGITHSRGQKDTAGGREQFERRISAFSFQDPASRIKAYQPISRHINVYFFIRQSLTFPVCVASCPARFVVGCHSRVACRFHV